MAEQWKNEATFRTMADDEVHVHITPNWDVFINHEDEPRPNLSGHAAVVLGGFVASLDVVMLSSDIYKRSDEAYRFAVEKRFAKPLEDMPEFVTSRDFGKYVQRIIKPVRSPFKTNILQLNASALKKVLLACSDTYDDKFVRSIIEDAELSGDESVNAFFIRNLLAEYESKKATGTSVAIAKVALTAAKSETGSDSDSMPQDSPSDGGSLDIIIDSHQVTDASVPYEETSQTDYSQDGILENPTLEETVTSSEETEEQKVILTPEVPIVLEFIPSGDVVKSVGVLIFEAEAGTIFTELEIKELVKIRTSDSDKIRSALFALTNAGFLRTAAREMGTYYERLDKPNPTDKD